MPYAWKSQMKAAVFGAFGIFLCNASLAQDVDSATFMVPHCKEALQPHFENPFSFGCIEIIKTFAYVGKILPPNARFCVPPNVSTQEMIRAVVTFMENRPAMMDENFRALALVALDRTWPCRE